MNMRLTTRIFSHFAALLFVTAAPRAQNRLVIDVSKAKRSTSSSKVIHYQGTGSIRHSDQHTYEAAQERRSKEAAQSRVEAKEAEARRTTGSQSRSVRAAQERRTSEATERHGSVRLDTIR